MKQKLQFILPILCVFFLLDLSAQTTANLTPVKDNSIYSESNNSNGLGRLYSGRTGSTDGNNNRRALIKFDLTSIPNGATITSVTLTLNVSRVPGGVGTQTYNIYELTTDWGEGTSTGTGNGAAAVAPDTTWSDAMLGTSNWTAAGGDFSPTALSTLSLSGLGNYDFPTSTTFVSVAQQWLDNPSTNNGLILIGDETVNRSARQFGSKDSGIAPILNVTYNTLSTEEFSLTNFYIIPNPATSSIKLELPSFINEIDISAFDVLGKNIYSAKHNSNVIIDVANWTPGIYLLKVSSENVSKTKRFVKI
ncbi:DNRLRE domain-containing protein [Hyunsoonleella flava]|nr:DNRLRE domain-containing protein [Hyunsoonleella flava]